MPAKALTIGSDAALNALLTDLRKLIRQSRQHALRAVNAIQVQICWQVGRHIVEFEQGGAERAAYGARLLTRLAESLTAEFGKGFDASNLRYMRLFYQAFPNRDALRHELSWTHYRALSRVESEKARHCLSMLGPAAIADLPDDVGLLKRLLAERDAVLEARAAELAASRAVLEASRTQLAAEQNEARALLQPATTTQPPGQLGAGCLCSTVQQQPGASGLTSTVHD